MYDTDATPQHHPPSPLALPGEGPNGQTGRRHPQYDQLMARLEARYEFHTAQLARLTAGHVSDATQSFTDDSLAATSRQALAVIAAALRDMAEGRYGVCDGCGESIPTERLEVRPEARFCVPCQARRTT